MFEIVNFIVSLSIAIFDYVVFSFFTSMINEILDKSRSWLRYLSLWIGLLLFQTGVYTWLPGRFGYAITVYDGAVIFRDNAIIYNLGIQLLLHALAIGAALAKYLWKTIRKKVKFLANAFFLELLIVIVCAVAGGMLIDYEEQTSSPYFSNSSNSTTVAIIFTVAGLVLFLLTVFLARGKGKKTETSDPEAIRRYDQVVEEWKRLSQKGDYASLIPLLLEATNLSVDAARKAQIWNLLGIAYKEIGSDQKAKEFYLTAQSFDVEDASSYNNLAMLCYKNHDFNEAERYMEQTLTKAKARRQNLGLYYFNYALIERGAGNRPKAEKYLSLAEQEGYDAAAIRNVRQQMQGEM